MTPRTALLTAALAALAGCQEPALPPELANTAHDPHPQTPTIQRDVALIDDDVQFTQPFVPGHRTTMDGRVALRVQGGPPGTERIAKNLSFFLFAPEKLQDPIMAGPPGAAILAEPEPFDVVFPPAADPEVVRTGHHAICDPTEEFAVAGERPNPYPCGPDTLHDCYDLTVISTTTPNIGAQLWGTPVTIEVTDPKTVDARIVRAELGEPVRGIVIPSAAEFTEPAVTVDGRLLTGRFGRFPRSWTNPETGVTIIRPYDLTYAQLPDDAEPCDVTRWTTFHPMSHAPYDPRMIGRYGLAAQPFRDTEGNPIPDGEDLGGTYPWVDREGANVFMAGVHGRVSEQSHERFPRRCVHEGCEEMRENVDWDRGFMVGGLWTHGKFVHLDAMINNQDWAVGVTPAAHYMVDLYKDAAGDPVPVRFGAGRFVDAARSSGGPYPDGYTHNANILDSLQNLPNHHAAASPITPRDVVWIMSTGVATDEVIFDDLLDPHGVIVSDMQGSITQLYDGDVSLAVPRYHNGQVRSLEGATALLADYLLLPDEVEDVHVQNGATSTLWEVPAYGLVEAGQGRIEPVALGGIQGKGFWLSGDAGIRYTMPAQTRDVSAHDWYVGIFVDSRTDELRTLLSFPDGTAIVRDGGSVQYVSDGLVVHAIDLSTGDGWTHLAWQIRDGGRQITFLHDGLPLDRVDAEAPMFQLTPGDLVVGRDAEPWTGLRGWVDELRVLAHTPNPEVSCNHARGTLVRVDDHDAWSVVAARHPDWAHAEVAAAAGEAVGARFACFHDHGDDHAAHLRNLPAGTAGVRDAINFPEGPIRAGMPRPDSSANGFCLSCHHTDGEGGLGLDALRLDTSTIAEDDPRRQPTQPPRRVFGNIPADWIPAGHGPGSPGTAMQAPPEGLLIDPWVLPN